MPTSSRAGKLFGKKRLISRFRAPFLFFTEHVHQKVEIRVTDEREPWSGKAELTKTKTQKHNTAEELMARSLAWVTCICGLCCSSPAPAGPVYTAGCAKANRTKGRHPHCSLAECGIHLADDVLQVLPPAFEVSGTVPHTDKNRQNGPVVCSEVDGRTVAR